MITNKVEFKAQKTPPNPKEVDYWVDTATNPNGGSIKYHRIYMDKFVEFKRRQRNE